MKATFFQLWVPEVQEINPYWDIHRNVGKTFIGVELWQCHMSHSKLQILSTSANETRSI